jgi:3,5-epimerase/4-reductase
VTTIVVFGRGFVGTRLALDLPGAELVATDITDRAAVRDVLSRLRPRAIINAAGKTGRPNVDWCETHKSETYAANVAGPLVLAEECDRARTYMLHLGSGCIFYGPSPVAGGWRESDFANPSAYYSRCKYAADLVLGDLPHVGIARLRMPIDGAPGSRNLITKLAAYKEVIDVENSVTVVDDLVTAVAGLVERRAAGIFHVTNPGTMRHRDLLALYRELVDPACPAVLIEEAELVRRGLAAKSRSNCILADTRLASAGISLRPIDVALRDAMTKYAASKAS